MHRTKKISTVIDAPTIDSSCLAEGVGSTRASDLVELALNYLRAMGKHQNESVLIGTDNSANLAL